MPQRFVILAGRKALPIIRDEGLDPDRVQVVAGAAGGPKWLVLYGLDRWLFGEYFKDRRAPLHLVGSSIGSWRFAAASVKEPVSGIDNFKVAYFRQRYSARPSAAEVSKETRQVLDGFIGDVETRQILAHPSFRPAILTVRCRNLALASESVPLQAAALGFAALCNAASRTSLRFFFQRTLFHHPAGNGFWGGFDDFPERKIGLNERNLREAVMASGSIPLVMAGVSDIPGAPRGVYRDGGIIDYHLNLKFPCDSDRLVLFPHYADHVIPGWFDKKVAWRKPVFDYLDNVVLVAPSPEFVAGLPQGKISDRKDFQIFSGRDDERIKSWQTIVDQSMRLAEDIHEAIGTGMIRDLVKPLERFS
jgi:hypothetical protein